MISFWYLRDSDDEAEGKVPAAAKKPLETIVNEVEAMGEEVVPEVSGENKAAAELMKIGMARNTEDSTLLMEESDETRMALTQGKGAVGDPVWKVDLSVCGVVEPAFVYLLCNREAPARPKNTHFFSYRCSCTIGGIQYPFVNWFFE